MKPWLRLTILIALGVQDLGRACIWDADTLSDEKKHSPTLATAILSPETPAVDVTTLRARIEKLRATPKEDDPD